MLGCHVTKASISDQEGFIGILDRFYLASMQKIWVDQAYMGHKRKNRCAEPWIDLEVVKKKRKDLNPTCPLQSYQELVIKIDLKKTK